MSLLAAYLEHIVKVVPDLIAGSVITIEITSFSLFFGLVLGTIAGLWKLSEKIVLRYPSIVYVDFIRGTPFWCKYCSSIMAYQDFTPT